MKLRGYRIEPGEIEQALREHEAVQDAVVVVYGDEEEKRLVAYVVAAAEAVSVSELRRTCGRLPEYMVPWSYEYLERLPLNANGKVDRDALPRRRVVRNPLENMRRREPQLESSRDIWSQVLGLQRVGIKDNFFQLGGHSLMAMQIVSRVRKTFKWSYRCAGISSLPQLPNSLIVLIRSGDGHKRKYKSAAGAIGETSTCYSPLPNSGYGSWISWSPDFLSTTYLPRFA